MNPAGFAICITLGARKSRVAARMENSFFYTFSTIAQTLAGAIALLAAFVLYRLQSLNAEIEIVGDRLAAWVDLACQQPPQQVINPSAFSLQGRNQYRELSALAERITVPANFDQAEFVRERLPVLLKGKSALVRRFGVALSLTIGLITVSIVVLTVAPFVAASSWACFVLAGAAIWFAACMLAYIWFLLKVFGERVA